MALIFKVLKVWLLFGCYSHFLYQILGFSSLNLIYELNFCKANNQTLITETKNLSKEMKKKSKLRKVKKLFSSKISLGPDIDYSI